MGDKTEERVSTQGDGSSEQVVEKTISMEDFRKFQSSKDKREAQLQRQLEEQQEQIKKLMDTLASPEQRAKMQQDMTMAELERLRRKERMQETMDWYAQKGVPKSVMEDADDESDAALKAVEWLAGEKERLEKESKAGARKEHIEEQEKSGALDVNIEASPSPTGVKLGSKELDKEYRDRARQTGKNTFADWYKAGGGKTIVQKGGSPSV
jgi:hypothetical protein